MADLKQSPTFLQRLMEAPGRGLTWIRGLTGHVDHPRKPPPKAWEGRALTVDYVSSYNLPAARLGRYLMDNIEEFREKNYTPKIVIVSAQVPSFMNNGCVGRQLTRIQVGQQEDVHISVSKAAHAGKHSFVAITSPCAKLTGGQTQRNEIDRLRRTGMETNIDDQTDF
jgi:hypothetical protein